MLVADGVIKWTDPAPYLLGICSLRVEFVEALKKNFSDVTPPGNASL